jgi:hypothetical protein
VAVLGGVLLQVSLLSILLNNHMLMSISPNYEYSPIKGKHESNMREFGADSW